MKYKLTYWNIRGRAEPIRLIFAAAHVEFEDIRLSKEKDWPHYKPLMPWNQVPILQVDNQQVLAQSLTICRYLATNFGLVGSTPWDNAKCDEYADAINDLIPEMKKLVHEKDPSQKALNKKEFLAAKLPACLSKFETILESNTSKSPTNLHLVGNSLTWTDIFVSTMLDRCEHYAGHSYLAHNYPNLDAFRTHTYNQPGIKEYIATRPTE